MSNKMIINKLYIWNFFVFCVNDNKKAKQNKQNKQNLYLRIELIKHKRCSNEPKKSNK